MKIALAICAISLCLATAARAQDNSFTPEDEVLLQQCFEAVRDTLDAEPDTTTSLRDCIGAASNVCQEDDPSTHGIVACSGREQSWWDQQLNFYYAELKSGLPPDVFDSLRTAQRSWIAYRDARCDYEYRLWGEGTMRQIIGAYCWMEMTAERAIDLSGDLESIDNF